MAPARGDDGREWTAFRTRLFSHDGPFFGKPCYHCGHPIIPGCGTVQHLISPAIWPEGKYRLGNLVPAHHGDYRRTGGPNKRCPLPECDLDCQSIAAGNTCPRDEEGRPLPFPAAYLAEKQRERRAFLARGGTPRSARKSAESSGTARNPVSARSAIGREW